MIILNNEKITSRSGPAKSILLLKQKVFKNKKIFYIFRTHKRYFFDIIVGKKKLINKNIFFIYNLLFKTKVIYIN